MAANKCLAERSKVWEGVAGRLRGMTTIVRKSYPDGRCCVLGEMIDETETRYFYRRRYGHALAFAEKQSPVIHLGPCKSCPDYSSPAESAGSPSS